MPGFVFRGRSTEAVAEWREGALYGAGGVDVLLSRRGGDWVAGRSAAAAWRTRAELIYRGGSAEPYCRVGRGVVYRGNSSETLWRIVGDQLLPAAGAEPVVRGPGLSPEELVLAALVLEPPR